MKPITLTPLIGCASGQYKSGDEQNGECNALIHDFSFCG